MDDIKLNADRFSGFSDLYHGARPQMPAHVIEIVCQYLGKRPDVVVDLGCGTGLSTFVWQNHANQIIGVEPSEDMLGIASRFLGDVPNIEFLNAFSNDIPIKDESVDVIICSQSFHWMNPQQTLAEVNRILKPNGIFATVDCDWPPVCNWVADLAYETLLSQVSELENNDSRFKDTYIRWEKEEHLNNIKNSGYFRYAREIVFSNREDCNANRYIALATSQGGMQTIMKNDANLLQENLDLFEKEVYHIFDKAKVAIDFCYRMRIGVK